MICKTETAEGWQSGWLYRPGKAACPFRALAIKNTNKIALSSVSIDYVLNNSDGDNIVNGSASLLSILPGETQYAAIEFEQQPDQEDIEDIDFDTSEYHITVQDNTEYYTYTKLSSGSGYSITAVLNKTTDEPSSVDITLKNLTENDIDISYLIYFYKSFTIFDVYTENQPLAAEETLELNIPAPYTSNPNYTYVPLATSIKCISSAHKIMDKE